MTKSLPENYYPAGIDKLSLKTQRIIGDVVPKLLHRLGFPEQDTAHPWEKYLEGMNRADRRLAGVPLLTIPDPPPSPEELADILNVATHDMTDEIYFKGQHIPLRNTKICTETTYKDTEDPTIIIVDYTESTFQKLPRAGTIPAFSEAEKNYQTSQKAIGKNPFRYPSVTTEHLSLAENVWASVGLVKLNNGKWAFAMGSDHLVSDGEVLRKFGENLSEKLHAEPFKPGEMLSYVDGDRNVIASVVDPTNQITYRELIPKIAKWIMKEGKPVSITMPALSKRNYINDGMIATTRRLSPANVIVTGLETTEQIDTKINDAVKIAMKTGGVSEPWLRFESPSHPFLRQVAKGLERFPFGKRAHDILSGDVLLSVLSTDMPIAATTPITRPDALEVIITRNRSRKDNGSAVNSVTISGSIEAWPAEKIKNLLNYLTSI